MFPKPMTWKSRSLLGVTADPAVTPENVNVNPSLI